MIRSLVVLLVAFSLTSGCKTSSAVRTNPFTFWRPKQVEAAGTSPGNLPSEASLPPGAVRMPPLPPMEPVPAAPSYDTLGPTPAPGLFPMD